MMSCGERMRKVGIIASRAMLIEIDGDWEGRCQVLAVDIANEEGRLSWTDLFGRAEGLRHARWSSSSWTIASG
jgi:transposase-like protein